MLAKARAALAAGDAAGALALVEAGLRGRRDPALDAFVGSVVDPAARRAADAKRRADEVAGARTRPEYRAAGAAEKEAAALGRSPREALARFNRAAEQYNAAATAQRTENAAEDLRGWAARQQQQVADRIGRKEWTEAERVLNEIRAKAPGTQNLDALQSQIAEGRRLDAAGGRSATAANRGDSGATTPPTRGGGAATPPVATPPGPDPAEAQVRQALQAFGQAYEARSIDSIRLVWPNIDTASRSRLEQYFRGYRDIRWSAGSTQVTFGSDGITADVQSSVTTQQTPIRASRAEETSMAWTFKLTRSGPGWRISQATWRVVR